MLASQAEIKNKIDQQKLSHEGYARQLARGGTDPARRERLESDVRLLAEEIATLEKLLQLGRAVDDRSRIEQISRERLAEVREVLAANDALKDLSPQEREYASGEVTALVWALGEDMLTLSMKEVMRSHEQADPNRTNRALPAILIHQLQEAPDAETRASAAYELGKLHIVEAIPNLVTALKDKPLVAEIASSALGMFTPEELKQAGMRTP